MKRVLQFAVFILFAGITDLSCKKKSYSIDDFSLPPVASAGEDQVIYLPADNLILDGSASRGNNISHYRWVKISGPDTLNIVNPNTSKTEVLNLLSGVYKFELEVKNIKGSSSKDTVQVMVVICNSRAVMNAQLIPVGTLSEKRAGIAAGVAGNKIVFAGGWKENGLASSRSDIYDINTQSWSSAELTIARWDIAVASSDSKIFFAGGISLDNGIDYPVEYSNVDIYDASTNIWTIDFLNKAGRRHAAAAVGNKIFFAGGSFFSERIDIYDISLNAWSIDKLSESRHGMSATTIGDKIYFAGGSRLAGSDQTYSNKIDIFNSTSGSWSLSFMSQSKSNMASIASGNKIYWAGGAFNYDQATNLSKLVEIRDVDTQISTFACLFQPNAGFHAVARNDKIIFFTGNGDEINKFDIYDISTDTWSIGVLNQSIRNATIISVNNNLYVAGGYVNGVLSNQVWKLEF